MNKIRVVALLSGVYDTSPARRCSWNGRSSRSCSACLFLIRPFTDLNGTFLLAVGLGYAIRYRDPERGSRLLV